MRKEMNEVIPLEISFKKVYYCKCGNAQYPHKNIKKKELHGKGELMKYDSEIKYCCEDMRGAINERFVILGDYESGLYVYSFAQDPRTINISHCSPFPEGPVWDTMEICYCPFCGTKIKINYRPMSSNVEVEK